MTAHEIRIDQSRTLTDEPGAGHNRWHPDIPPILTIEPGDEVLMETRDGGDLQISRSSTLDDLLRLDLNAGHALDRGGYYAATGLCIERDGTNRAEDINLATRNALLNVIDHLVCERGSSRMQAYVIASVGVDVTVDGIAAVPNTVVPAILPDDIFV